MNNRKLKVLLPLLFSLVLIVGIYIGFKLRENTITARNFFRLEKKSPLQEVLDLINRKYVDKVNTDTIADDAIQEMLKHLDPHSVFIPAVNLQNINADLKGNFEGIGVEFMIIKDTVNITNVLAGGPSEKAGLQVGDKLLEADDSNITGPVMNSDSIRNRLRGPGGSSVKVKMLRGSEILNANITRGRIPIPSIDAAHMIDDSTGFIRLNKFSETTYE
ncbi:MAG TPA: PDZ domain-containing protein, partial [Parasegetibacter sp.]